MSRYKTFHLYVTFAVMAAVSASALAQSGSDWVYGIGTGLNRLNAKGDVGLTALGEARYGDLDLSASDFNDLMDSAIGGSFFAANSQWKISLTYATLTLKDTATIDLPGPIPDPLVSKFKQDVTFAEGTVEYKFAKTGEHVWGVIGGIRNTEHKYNIQISVGANGVTRKLKQDWTDVLVGLTHSYPFSPRVVWNNVAMAGFGDSDSYYAIQTSVNWQFARHWNTGLFFAYKWIDFENDNPGDSNWYLYDVDEFGPGLSIAYIF